MQIYVKRSKIFMNDSNGKHQRVALTKQDGPQPAPDWVRNAPGFKEGIKDGSIIDLTPVPQPVAVAALEAEDGEDEENGDEEPKIKAAEVKSRRPRGAVTASATKL